jgi:PAS domain S-box-containing protein
MDGLTLTCHSGLELRAVKRWALPEEADRSHCDWVDHVHAARPHAEPRQRALLDEIDDGFVAIDWEWTYIYANPVALELLRHPEEEVLGRTVWELFPEVVGTEFEQRCRLAMEQGVPSHFEFCVERHAAWYELRVYPTLSGISVYFNDVTKHKTLESAKALQGEALVAINEILLSALETETEEELGEVCLTVAAKLSGSAFGFIGQVGDDGLLHDIAISDPGWAACGMHDRSGHRRPPGDFALHGLYGEVLLTGETLLTNAPAKHPRSVGLPPGHPPLVSFLGVPLRSHGRTVGIIALANREGGYGEEQREILESIAPTVVAAFERRRRRAAEERERLELRETAFDNRVLRAFVEYEGDEMFDRALAVVLEKMASKHGVFGYVAQPGHLMCPSLSKMLDSCEVEGKCIHYPPEKWKGLWARALTEKRSLYANSASRVPPGHPAIQNNLATPILFHGEVIGLLNIANRDGGYTDADRDLLDHLAARVAPVLYAWIQRTLREEERRAAEGVLREHEAWLRGQRKALEAAMNDAPLETSLGVLVRTAADGLGQDVRAAFYLANSDRTSLHHVVGMPAAYAEAIDGSKIGPESLACGLATHTGQPVLTSDVKKDALWEPWLWLAERFEYRACWSFPINTATGECVGTLAVYFGQPRAATERDLELASLLTNTASIIVSRHRESEARKRTEADLRRSRKDLDRAQGVGQLGSWRLDVREDVLSWSDETYRIFGLPIGTPLTYEIFLSLVHPDDRTLVDAQWQAALRGEPYDVEHRLLVEGQVKWVREKAFLEHDEAGELLGGFGITQDITDRKRAEEELARRARFGEELNRLNAMLATLAPSDRLLELLLTELARLLGAESASIGMLHEQGLQIVSALGIPGVEGRTYTPDEAPIVWLAHEGSEPQAVEDCEHDPRVVPEVQRRLDVRSALVVPLASGGKQLGQLCFNWHTRSRRFQSEEIDFAKQAGANASAMLRTARLLEEQQRIATTLQEHLLHPLPFVSGLELATRSLPASDVALVGGDFSDVFVLPDGRVALLIGDVAGKGMRAAALTETVRSMVRAFASIDTAPAFVLRKTNELLLRYDPEESHVTALLCVVDPSNGHLALGSAGHPGPILLSRHTCEVLELPYGTPLGSLPADYSSTHATLALDDCLVLYTDGVTEARRGKEFFGDEGLLDAVRRLRDRSAEEVARGIADSALAFGGRLRDDVQILVVRLA